MVETFDDPKTKPTLHDNRTDVLPVVSAQDKPLKNTPHRVASDVNEHHSYSKITLHPSDTQKNLGYYRNPPAIIAEQGFPPILFENDARKPTQEGVEQLAQEASQIRQFLQKNPDMKLEINGHASKAGNAAYNKSLSVDRANGIAEQLQSMLPEYASRIHVISQGYGAERTTDKGEQADRRVEVRAVHKSHKQYHEMIHIPPDAYPALQKTQFTLDLGRGAISIAEYGQPSPLEAQADIIFEPPSGALKQPANFKLVVDDIKNPRIFVRNNDANIPTSIVITDSKHVAIYHGEQKLANIAVEGPDGKARDLSKLSVGVIDSNEKIHELSIVSPQGILTAKEKAVFAAPEQARGTEPKGNLVPNGKQQQQSTGYNL